MVGFKLVQLTTQPNNGKKMFLQPSPTQLKTQPTNFGLDWVGLVGFIGLEKFLITFNGHINVLEAFVNEIQGTIGDVVDDYRSSVETTRYEMRELSTKLNLTI